MQYTIGLRYSDDQELSVDNIDEFYGYTAMVTEEVAIQILSSPRVRRCHRKLREDQSEYKAHNSEKRQFLPLQKRHLMTLI